MEKQLSGAQGKGRKNLLCTELQSGKMKKFWKCIGGNACTVM